jgi:hypothetical protein
MDHFSQTVVPFMIERLNASEFMERHYRGADFPPSRFPVDPAVYWSKEFANLLTMTAVGRQQLVWVGEGRLEEVEAILALLEAAREEF